MASKQAADQWARLDRRSRAACCLWVLDISAFSAACLAMCCSHFQSNNLNWQVFESHQIFRKQHFSEVVMEWSDQTGTTVLEGKVLAITLALSTSRRHNRLKFALGCLSNQHG